jgi:hypothetical protein
MTTSPDVPQREPLIQIIRDQQSREIHIPMGVLG